MEMIECRREADALPAWKGNVMKIMKIKNLILGALLLLLAAGCNNDNSNSNTANPSTNAPVATNGAATTNK
jgi:hypothetical protein